MYEYPIQRDFFRAETDFRLGRARAELSRRRIRRALRGEDVGRGDVGDWTPTTAR